MKKKAPPFRLQTVLLCKVCGGEGRVFVLRPKKSTHMLVPCPECSPEEDASKKELEKLLG
jgi:DnaJ-class molecular chaperone